MDSQQPPPQARGQTRKRRPVLRVILILAALGTLALILIVALPTSRTPGIVWLSRDEFERADRPALLMGIKWALTGSIQRFFHHQPLIRRPYYEATINVANFATNAAVQMKLGAPSGTNSGGMHAWILPPDKTGFVKRLFDADPDGIDRSSAALITEPKNGLRGKIQLIIRRNVPSGTISNEVDCRVIVIPQALSDPVEYCLEVESCVPGPPQMVQWTNFVADCKVALPKGGGVLINTRRSPEIQGQEFWVLVIPEFGEAKLR